VKGILAGAIGVALALASSGCAMTFDSSHLGVTATMAEPAQAPAPGTAFRVTKHPVYLLMGLVPLGQPNLEDLFAGQVGADSAIAGLKIRVRSRWTDLLITVITAGLVAPRSVTYEGVVVGRAPK
jgi:protein-S-isoprenylcysteine O-methyltransferase Ste14